MKKLVYTTKNPINNTPGILYLSGFRELLR